MSDRELILARIRAALVDVPGDEPAQWAPAQDADPAAAYARAGEADAELLAEEFALRCGEYRAHVVRCGGDGAAIREAVRAACERHAAGRLAAPTDLAEEWRPEGVMLRRDSPPLSLAELDACDGVLSGCALAIAPTGTIVLDAGPAQGRRALSLVPDLHICVVRSEQIVNGLPRAFAELNEAVGDRRPITLISGPSATSDIELRRVEGVHGPRRLEVIVAGATGG